MIKIEVRGMSKLERKQYFNVSAKGQKFLLVEIINKGDI